MNPGKISVWVDSNERPPKNEEERKKHRITHLIQVASEDPRFELEGFRPQDVDLQFEYTPGWVQTGIPNAYFNVELKLPSDYIASALGPTGHLADQILTMREAGHPCMVLVLGDDADVQAACLDALKTRYRGQNLAFQIGSYSDRLIDFEANAGAMGVPVMRWKAQPWRRLLSLAHKTLTGGNLYGYRPRPADGERELIAASTMFKGIGPETCKSLLEDYKLRFVPKSKNARPLDELPGIGPKRARLISDYVVWGVA